MNMFEPNDSKTVEEYFGRLPKDRQKALRSIDSLIRRVAPSLKPYFANNMPGYGSFPYKNYRKETGEWPIIALASRKDYISIYVCSLDGDEYVAEKHKKALGKVSVGKSCIRFRNIEDLDLNALEKVIKFAAKNPGLTKESAKGKKG